MKYIFLLKVFFTFLQSRIKYINKSKPTKLNAGKNKGKYTYQPRLCLFFYLFIHEKKSNAFLIIFTQLKIFKGIASFIMIF